MLNLHRKQNPLLPIWAIQHIFADDPALISAVDDDRFTGAVFFNDADMMNTAIVAEEDEVAG